MIESQTPKKPEEFDSPHGSGRGGQTEEIELIFLV